MPVIKCTADLTANPPVTFDVRYSSTDLSQATSTPDLATMTHIGHYEIPPKKDTVRKVDTMARPVEKQNNRQTAETAPAANTSAKMEKIWWTGAGGQRNGPFTLAEITAQAKENTLTAETLVWCKSMDNWQAAGKVPSLKVLFSALPPPLPAE